VLFPGGRLPLRLFEQRYLEMAKACFKDGSAFGVCLILEGREVGEPALPAEIGTTARIDEWDMPQLGVLQIVAKGEQRFRIRERRVQPDGLAVAQVELLAEGADAPIPESCEACVRILRRVVDDHGALFPPPHGFASSAWVSARLAEVMPLPLQTKQALLALDDPRERLLRLNALLASARAGS
jgi:Lon protease-like protein